MIRITIDTQNAAALKRELETLLGCIPATDIRKDVRTAIITPQAPPSAEEPPTIELDALPETDAPTMEATRAKLNALRIKHGTKAVKELLTAYNVSSFTDLKPDQYAAVIAQAEEAMTL